MSDSNFKNQMEEGFSMNPLVSIGLPVYNGQNYVKEAIESVLNQTYSNIELVISDNGSTDNTQQICENFINKGNRILYHRYDKNLGAAKNYNNTFEMSSGKYFRWLAHDDKLLPQNISKSVEILEENKDVVICTGSKIHIDAEGKQIDANEDSDFGYYDDRQYKNLNINHDDPVVRYKQLLKYFSKSFSNADFVFGVIRSEYLQRTSLIGNYTSSDFTLLAELVLNGKFYAVDEPLFLRRIHPGVSTSVYNNKPDEIKNLSKSDGVPMKSHAQIAKWFDPKGKVRYIPHFKWLEELIKGFLKLQWTVADKIKLFSYSFRWFCVRITHAIKVKIQESKLFNLIQIEK